MKNLRLLSLVTVSMIACASVGYAKDYYVSGQVGAALAQGKLTSENLLEGSGSGKKSLNNAAVFDVIVGRNINSNLSAELEVAYSKHKFARKNTGLTNDINISTKISSVSSFVNGSYKFENLNIGVIPYVTAGIGFSSNKTDKINYNYNSILYTTKNKTINNFVWQVGVGALIPVNENISINLSCKYRDLGKVASVSNVYDNTNKVEDNLGSKALKGRIHSVNLLAGISLSF